MKPLMGRAKHRRSRGRRTRVLLGAAAALVVGVSSGTAYAYLTSTGSGTGAALVDPPFPVTVEAATGTVTDELVPGGRGDLLVRLDNPNDFPVDIVAVAAGTGTVTESGGIGSCTNTGVAVFPQIGLRISVAPNANSDHPVSVVIPNGVTMGTTSDSGCQGATFHVPVAITVHRG